MNSIMVNRWITLAWLEAGGSGKAKETKVKAVIAFADSLEGPDRLRELEFIMDWCLEHHRPGDMLLDDALAAFDRINYEPVRKELEKILLGKE